MKKVKNCPLCGEGKQKRSCKLQHDELICLNCCLKKQNYYCNGCSFYQDKILKFKCVSCGKTSIDEPPSDIAKLMGAKIFKLDTLEGNKFDKEFVLSGEKYTTSLEFPFEGKTNSPIWFYFDPEDSYHTLQLLQGEILEVKNFDEYKAQIEMFVHQTGKCENINNLFPEKEMPESLYNIENLFPVGSLKTSTFENFTLVSSMAQDGGNWIVIIDDDIDPRIILYAEGWFSHWQSYAGNIKIKNSFFQQILNLVNTEK